MLKNNRVRGTPNNAWGIEGSGPEEDLLIEDVKHVDQGNRMSGSTLP